MNINKNPNAKSNDVSEKDLISIIDLEVSKGLVRSHVESFNNFINKCFTTTHILFSSKYFILYFNLFSFYYSIFILTR